MFLKAIIQARRSELFTVRRDATLHDATHLLAQHHIGALLVTGPDGDIVGILSERDVARAVHSLGGDAPARSVSEFMTADPVVCTIDDSLHAVMSVMDRHRIRHLPVTDGERVVAMVSIRDVIEHLLRETAIERDALCDYIATSG